jgi:hypothetical protein
MSFTFGISRTCGLILTLIAGATITSHANAAGQDKKTCDAYAFKAWETLQTMKQYKCSTVGDMGPGRFSQSYQQHHDWCSHAASKEGLEFEERERENEKAACGNQKLQEMVCEKYANDAVQMSNQYQINRCTTEHHPTGRFDYRFQAHYNWCLYSQHGAGAIYSEEEARATDLEACKQRNAESRYKPVKKLGVKHTKVEDQSAPDESSEERLQVSDAIEGLDADAGYTPIRKLKIKPAATQLIVVGNRYVEVPAYSDPDEGSGLGTVVKAGAAAVVVGTAAVPTGVVAAKVLDYADDYKGGINKSMSGAAEALKEKLKDRLDGGGINKSASGVVEAMKEKIKDGFQGGGINKSMSGAAAALKEKLKDRVASGGGITKTMSGAKEALKYKLKERVASGGLVSKAASGFKEKVKSRLTGGGGGGLMTGMAKASGGVLRGLLRR